MRPTLAALALLFSVSSSSLAQQPTALPADKMKDLAGLVGNWQGTGWLQYEGTDRMEFNATETIESRLDGLVLVLEGRATAEAGATVYHHGLSILTFDPQSRRYMMVAIREDGSHVVTEVAQDQGFLEWSFDDPELGRVKHTVRLTESGQMFAVGDHSKDDGATWRRHYEMQLSRQR
jgi:hypothetical protein